MAITMNYRPYFLFVTCSALWLVATQAFAPLLLPQTAWRVQMIHQHQQLQSVPSDRHVASSLQTLYSRRNNDDILPSPDSSRRRLCTVPIATLLATAVLPLTPPPSAYATTGPPPLSKDLKDDYRQGTAALGDMDDQAPVPREAYRKLPSGVVYADLRPGTGSDVAHAGSKVNLQWVLRKSNGYFVDSSAVSESVPFIFTVGDGKAIAGVDEAVRGMQVGGVRRMLIPPSLAYVEGLEDGKPGPIPVGFGPKQQMRRVQTVRKDVPGEYIFLEMQLTRMR